MEKQGESQAALPITDENDYVIALRLTRWPKYVLDCIQEKYPEEIFKLVQGKYFMTMPLEKNNKPSRKSVLQT